MSCNSTNRQAVSLKATTVYPSNYQHLEKKVTELMKENSAQRPYTYNIIRGEALSNFNTVYGVASDGKFKASDCWVNQLLKRNGVKHLAVVGHKKAQDQPAANTFSDNFQASIDSAGFITSQLFNADETSLTLHPESKRCTTSLGKSLQEARSTKKHILYCLPLI